jgi:hypothetical protein
MCVLRCQGAAPLPPPPLLQPLPLEAWPRPPTAAHLTSMRRTTSLAAVLILGQGAAVKSSGAVRMARKICSSLSPKNGGTPARAGAGGGP